MAQRVPYQSPIFGTDPADVPAGFKGQTGSIPGANAQPQMPAGNSAPSGNNENDTIFGDTQVQNDFPMPDLPPIVSAGGTPTVPPTAQAVSPQQIAQNSKAQIDAYYEKYLGRKPENAAAYESWLGNPNAEAGIANSPEAKARAQGQAYTPPVNRVPVGFDARKFNDPNHDTDKYFAARTLLNGGTMQDVVSRLNARGGTQYTLVGNDKVMDDKGDTYDLLFDEEGQRAPQWTLVAGPTWEAGAPGVSRVGAGGNAGGGNVRTGGGEPIPAWIAQLFGNGGSASGGVLGGGSVGTANLPGGFSAPEDDPLAALVNSGLAGLIGSGGSTPFGEDVSSLLMQVIGNGGTTPDIASKLIGARESAALAQQGLMEDARAALAGQGALSVPGVEQGGTVDTIGRITQNVGQDFAAAVRDIYSQALDESNESFMQSLQLATGLSGQQASTMLQALGQGTERQTAITGLALQQLSQSMDWQKFLATHALDTAKLEEDIANGRMDRVIQMLKLFLDGAGNAQQGYY